MTYADSFTCPVCDRISYHPKDIEEGYCRNCHAWTGRLPPGEANKIAHRRQHPIEPDPRDAEGALILPAKLTYEQLTEPGTHESPEDPPEPAWIRRTEWIATITLGVLLLLIVANLWRIFSSG